jgi:hypothetical protein
MSLVCQAVRRGELEKTAVPLDWFESKLPIVPDSTDA